MDTIDEVVKGWLKHRLVVHDLLELVDDEHIDFKPWDGAYTLGDLALHIATSMDMFAKLVKTGVFAPPNKETYQSMDDVRKLVQKYTSITKGDLKALTKSNISNEVEFNGDTAPGNFWLSNAIDHEIHHKGQLFTYVRMTGAQKVPFFMKHPSEV